MSTPARKRVAVLVSGGGSNMAALIAAAADPAFPAEIVRVICNRPDAGALAKAAAAGVETVIIDHRSYSDRETFDAAVDAALVAAETDIVCLAGFMRLLTPGFVEKWRDRMINIHPSLLPSFKGLHTHARALEADVTLHGCTVHFVRAEMDMGPIIVQAAVPVIDGDTAETLAARVLAAEHRIYPQALAAVASGRAVVDGERVVHTGGGEPPAAFVWPPA
ncbi:phosphoribosylglycinamide formyltransferase [Pseudoxanthobacter sp. M-2]|uniref:phosphoribosylglycinamide formyltransferase n=1 Tax=Pseudoxanthobacter sp. M-2 TaxID=3078754 RepID=UPI0038FCA3FA